MDIKAWLMKCINSSTLTTNLSQNQPFNAYDAKRCYPFVCRWVIGANSPLIYGNAQNALTRYRTFCKLIFACWFAPIAVVMFFFFMWRFLRVIRSLDSVKLHPVSRFWFVYHFHQILSLLQTYQSRKWGKQNYKKKSIHVHSLSTITNYIDVSCSFGLVLNKNNIFCWYKTALVTV